jgi:hypothetical protein
LTRISGEWRWTWGRSRRRGPAGHPYAAYASSHKLPEGYDAVLAAVITGAVALVAIVGTVVTTLLTLPRQRNAEDQRRRHERHMRRLSQGSRRQ